LEITTRPESYPVDIVKEPYNLFGEEEKAEDLERV